MTMMICSIPEATASSTAYWMIGRSTSGIISLGMALVAGRKRVPKPAAGRTAFLTRTVIGSLLERVASQRSARRVSGCADVRGASRGKEYSNARPPRPRGAKARNATIANR